MKAARCCVGGCDNDKRYPDRIVKHSNVVGKLRFHNFPANEESKCAWVQKISKGRVMLETENLDNYFVCSNHFVDGKPTTSN